MIRVVRILRWVLFFEGWLLLAAPAAVLRWISYLEQVLPPTATLFGQTAFFTFVCWTMGSLCLLTFWGQGLQKRWTRWTGLAVSLFNLAVFPPLGLTGLITIRRFARFHLPEDGDQSVITPETKSVRIARACLTAAVLLGAYNWLENFAASIGVRLGVFGWHTLLAVAFGQVGVSLTHDLAHTLAARALGARYPVFRLGPWSWMNMYLVGEPGGKRQWNRLFAHDSYLAGIPSEESRVRSNLILAAASGPFLSLLAALTLFLLMLRSAGTPLEWEGDWLGVLALLYAMDFSIHMLPFGYSDGKVLVDLISNNSRGVKLVHQLRESMDRLQRSGEPAAEAASGPKALRIVDPILQRRDVLNRMAERGVTGGVQLAQSHQDLGIAELLSGNLVSAREHLERSLDLFASCPNPAYKGRSWLWLAKLYRQSQLAAEANYAYGRALQCWQPEKSNPKSFEAQSEAKISLAHLKMLAGDAGAASDELEALENQLPKDPLLLASYHHAAAVAAYRMRWQDRGRQHVKNALKILLRAKVEPQVRGMALLHLGDFAWDLWQAGQAAPAAGILQTAIEGLQQGGAPELPNHLRLLRAEILAKTGQPELAAEELEALSNPGPEQERRAREIAGWIALASGEGEVAAEHFDSAANTLDERERARLFVAAARALSSAGNRHDATALARSACDVLIKEEHGEAGVALLLLAAHLTAEQPHGPKHPFFEEGLRILHAAHLQPPPDKLLALRDLVHMYDSAGRTIESSELQEEMMWILQQITWQTEDLESVPLHEPA